MFDIKTAKEIIIKPNKDGTFNIVVKYDLYQDKTIQIVSEVLCEYPRAKLELNIEVLEVGDGRGKYGNVTVIEK